MLEERVESKNVILKTRKFDIMKILIILNFKKEINILIVGLFRNYFMKGRHYSRKFYFVLISNFVINLIIKR